MLMILKCQTLHLREDTHAEKKKSWILSIFMSTCALLKAMLYPKYQYLMKEFQLSSVKDLLLFSFWTLVICSCWQSGSSSAAASDSTFSGGPAVDKWMTALAHWESPLCWTSGSEDVFLGNYKDGFNGIHIFFFFFFAVNYYRLQPPTCTCCMIKPHLKKNKKNNRLIFKPTSYN